MSARDEKTTFSRRGVAVAVIIFNLLYNGWFLSLTILYCPPREKPIEKGRSGMKKA
jgi:hypothetical protein